MSTPWAQGISWTSSASQFSTPIALDPLSKMTAVQVSISVPSTGTCIFYVQATLDGNGAWGSGTPSLQPTPQPVWGQVGSSIYEYESSAATSSNAVNTNLNALDQSATFVLLQPVAGLRLASSAAGAATGTILLRALQSPTA